LLAEVAGSLRYFGGMEALLERLRAGLLEIGFEASLAVASVPRAALWRARGGGQPLDELPLEVTGFEIDFLKSIGISKIGELLRLPRAGLAKRCGREILDDLDRVCGKVP